MANPTPAWDDNHLQNPHTVADKRRRVQEMFASIAPKYDLNNRLHSFGRDQAGGVEGDGCGGGRGVWDGGSDD
jgi:hypothetical protein